MLNHFYKLGFRSSDTVVDQSFRGVLKTVTEHTQDYFKDPSRHITSHYETLIGSTDTNRANAKRGELYNACVVDALAVFVCPQSGRSFDPVRFSHKADTRLPLNVDADILITHPKEVLRQAQLQQMQEDIKHLSTKTAITKVKRSIKALTKQRGEKRYGPTQLHLKTSVRERWQQVDRVAMYMRARSHLKPYIVGLFFREEDDHTIQQSISQSYNVSDMARFVDQYYTTRDSEAMLKLFSKLVNL